MNPGLIAWIISVGLISLICLLIYIVVGREHWGQL